MRDELRSRTVGNRECGIVNLQNSDQAGSHWVMYFRNDTHTIAYSSFGDPVSQELVEYLGAKIYTSDIQIQDFSEKSGRYYCIAILYLLSQKVSFEDIILGFEGGERR